MNSYISIRHLGYLSPTYVSNSSTNIPGIISCEILEKKVPLNYINLDRNPVGLTSVYAV